MRAISHRTGLPLRRVRVLVLAALLVLASSAFAAFGDASPARATQAPSNTQPPTIAGTLQQGQTLTAAAGTWTGDTPMTFSYQWLRCDPNGNVCNPISGATSTTYTVQMADVGNTLRIHVAATNAAGSGEARSAAVAIVAQNAPANTAPPTITGTPQEGQTLTAQPGTWTGATPMTFAYQWLRCNPGGQQCAPIAGATTQSYALTTADVGNTIRVRVTATNAAGTGGPAESAPTAQVASAGPAGQVPLPGGLVSIPVTSVSLPHRLVVSDVQFTPNPVRSRAQPITIRFRVRDTRGFVVRDALVFVRATPLVTSTPPERQTGTDGWVEFQVQPTAAFPLGLAVQFFVRARKANEPLLAGVSTRRLVQVRTAAG